jgi:outer membrane protein assembly factor BamE
MRTLAALVTLLMLSACSLPVFFRVPVVQGNVVTAENVGQLEIGMTKRQVEYVMGTSLIDSSFENDRLDYVFYYRDPRAHVRKSKLTLYFVNDQLSEIEGDEEYTEQIMKDHPGIGEDKPLPSEVTPAPNNEQSATPAERRRRSEQDPLGAPLPGT